MASSRNDSLINGKAQTGYEREFDELGMRWGKWKKDDIKRRQGDRKFLAVFAGIWVLGWLGIVVIVLVECTF
jgi:hypothetical protein